MERAFPSSPVRRQHLGAQRILQRKPELAKWFAPISRCSMPLPTGNYSVRKLRCLVMPFALLISCALSGCTTCTQDHHALAQPDTLKPSEGLVLVADGAGDFPATSHAFRQEIAAEKLPLHVETFICSHGSFRVPADPPDHEQT